MIAKLKGLIDEIKPTEVIIDVQGVGYFLHIPLSTYEKIHNEKEISLNVFTLHKEDQFKLFGFYDKNEKDLFSILLTISGIGPAMALSIISGISIEHLIDAVKTNNVSLLTKIPGIGKTKAEKLIFELQRKIKNFEKFSTSDIPNRSQRNDAIEALMSLGFDEIKSMKSVDAILQENAGLAVEEIIKLSLQTLSA